MRQRFHDNSSLIAEDIGVDHTRFQTCCAMTAALWAPRRSKCKSRCLNIRFNTVTLLSSLQQDTAALEIPAFLEAKNVAENVSAPKFSMILVSFFGTLYYKFFLRIGPCVNHH
jgi:hypothetical protein